MIVWVGKTAKSYVGEVGKKNRETRRRLKERQGKKEKSPGIIVGVKQTEKKGYTASVNI